MSPEAQRIAIAETCGWKRRNAWSAFMDKCEQIAVLPPDYLNDLNAMHEAEKMLSRRQRHDYWCELVKLCNNDARNSKDFDRVGVFFQLTATAAQRAEAFLRTTGQWKEIA